MKILKGMVYTLIIVLAFVFFMENYPTLSATISIRYNLYFFQVESIPFPVWSVILLSFLLGVVLAGFFGLYERYVIKQNARNKTREVARLEKEVNSLRNLPITEERFSEEEEQVRG
jgi:putative membrane protein